VLIGLLKSLQYDDDDVPANQACKITIADEIKRRWKLGSLTSIDAGSTVKTAPLIYCIVDPRFKECKFLGVNEQEEIKIALTDLVCKVKEANDSLLESSGTSQLEEASGPAPKKKCTGLDILLGGDYTTNESEDSEADPILKEVESYIKEKPIDREESPLVWWKQNQYKFPMISVVAKQFLSIPVTSTPAERVFSTAGLTVTWLWSSLMPEHVNMLVFLNKNC